jgi:hypothetical protein
MFNKNKVNLTFYTEDNSSFVNEKPTFKPDHPEWMKYLKNTFKHFDANSNSSYEVATVKNCPGIHYFMNEGIKIKMWQDLKIRVHPSGFVENLPTAVHSLDRPLVQHDPQQYTNLYPEFKTAFKLNNPWIAKCNKNIKFLFTESHYSTNFFRERNMYIAPGLIDFKYQSSLNVHIILDKKEKPYDLLIPYGTPLMTLFPLSDKKINLDYKLVSSEELNNLVQIFPRCPMRKYYQLIKNLSGSES